jgi:small GTP-binding protein
MSQKQNFTDTISIITIGDSSVGKTSIIRKFIDNNFSVGTLPTIGVELFKTELKINDEKYLIKIWDTCGQERLRALTSNYYKNADGIILVYDVNSNDSFLNLEKWFKSIDDNCGTKPPIIILGNKIDLGGKIDDDIMNNFKRDNKNYLMFECSAKKGININEAFISLSENIIKNKKNIEQGFELDKYEKNKTKSTCC